MSHIIKSNISSSQIQQTLSQAVSLKTKTQSLRKTSQEKHVNRMISARSKATNLDVNLQKIPGFDKETVDEKQEKETCTLTISPAKQSSASQNMNLTPNSTFSTERIRISKSDPIVKSKSKPKVVTRKKKFHKENTQSRRKVSVFSTNKSKIVSKKQNSDNISDIPTSHQSGKTLTTDISNESMTLNGDSKQKDIKLQQVIQLPSTETTSFKEEIRSKKTSHRVSKKLPKLNGTICANKNKFPNEEKKCDKTSINGISSKSMTIPIAEKIDDELKRREIVGDTAEDMVAFQAKKILKEVNDDDDILLNNILLESSDSSLLEFLHDKGSQSDLKHCTEDARWANNPKKSPQKIIRSAQKIQNIDKLETRKDINKNLKHTGWRRSLIKPIYSPSSAERHSQKVRDNSVTPDKIDNTHQHNALRESRSSIPSLISTVTEDPLLHYSVVDGNVEDQTSSEEGEYAIQLGEEKCSVRSESDIDTNFGVNLMPEVESEVISNSSNEYTSDEDEVLKPHGAMLKNTELMNNNAIIPDLVPCMPSKLIDSDSSQIWIHFAKAYAESSKKSGQQRKLHRSIVFNKPVLNLGYEVTSLSENC